MEINECAKCSMLCCNKNPIRKKYLVDVTKEVKKSMLFHTNDGSYQSERAQIFNNGVFEAIKIIDKLIDKGGD